MAFKALLNANTALSSALLKSSLPLLFKKTLPERAPTKTGLRCRLSIDTQLRVWAHQQFAYVQLSPLYLLSTLYVTHVINYSKPSSHFSVLQVMESWVGLGNEATLHVLVFIQKTFFVTCSCCCFFNFF